ncbi:MAG: GYD domain-containing protein [Deltaproteobacteria bacterium]|nr:GYD domain-containing protein [Deltaproteobacteria bacterium]
METFVMFGRYTSEGIQGISAERTKKTVDLLKQHGGELKAAYALLGATDLMLIVSLPGVAEAMEVSVALSKMTGIAFTTSPAVTVEEFDKMMSPGKKGAKK